MGDVARLIFLVHVGVGLAGAVLTAGIVTYGRISAPILRRQWIERPARTPTAAELHALARWSRRDCALFVAVMVAIVVVSVAPGLARVSPAAMALGYATMLIAMAGGLAYHFTARCPVCRRTLGFQSALGLPIHCEICDTPLRPGVRR